MSWLSLCLRPQVFGWFDHVAALVSAASSVRAVVAQVTFLLHLHVCDLASWHRADYKHVCSGHPRIRGLKRIVVVLFVGVVSFLWQCLWVFVSVTLAPACRREPFRVRLPLSGFSHAPLSHVACFLEATRTAPQTPHRSRLRDDRRIGRGTRILYSADWRTRREAKKP